MMNRKSRTRKAVVGRIRPQLSESEKSTVRGVLARGDGLYMVSFATGHVLTMDEYNALRAKGK